jgi:hypothetical protein
MKLHIKLLAHLYLQYAKYWNLVNAHQGTGKTIHSVSQLRHFGTIVDDTPRQFGGKQRLETLDGYIIPLSIRSGLPYMDMSPPTQQELDTQ